MSGERMGYVCVCGGGGAGGTITKPSTKYSKPEMLYHSGEKGPMPAEAKTGDRATEGGREDHKGPFIITWPPSRPPKHSPDALRKFLKNFVPRCPSIRPLLPPQSPSSSALFSCPLCVRSGRHSWGNWRNPRRPGDARFPRKCFAAAPRSAARRWQGLLQGGASNINASKHCIKSALRQS